jgi:hypothetical protein
MSEAPGVLIGLSNVMTTLRQRVPPGPDPDGTPGLRDRLRTNALRALEGPEAFIHDAILLGRRVRLFSNSHHLADFFRDHWMTEGEWKAATGRPVPRDPELTVYATIGVPAEAPASYTSGNGREAYLFNTSYYGDLRALAAEALGRRFEPWARILHGGAVEVNGRLLVLLYPKELIHPTPVWGLMEHPGARLLAEGWLAVDADGRAHALERRLYVRTSLVEYYPKHAAGLLASKLENVPPGAEASLRLSASPDSRAMLDASTLFGRASILGGPAEPAAVFRLTAETGEEIRPAPEDSFLCPVYEVPAGDAPGHPRELARRIAAR